MNSGFQAALTRFAKPAEPGFARPVPEAKRRGIKPSVASGLAACSGRDFLALSLPVAQRISSAAASPPLNAPGLIVVYAALQPQSTPGFTPAGFGRSAAAACPRRRSRSGIIRHHTLPMSPKRKRSGKEPARTKD